MPSDRPLLRAFCALACTSALFASPAGDWNNLGGTPGRNGLVDELGPQSLSPLWSNTQDPALIAWQPVISDGRLFTIREAGFPQNGGAANDALVCYDVHSGAEQWRTTLPYGGNTSTQWIAWIAGASHGRVFASRSENGKPNPIHAFDAATGQPLWTSQALQTAFAYDGTVFAPNGDLVHGDFSNVWRIDGATGATIWHHVRPRSVSGNCGVAITDTAVFTDLVLAGGHAIQKLDLATGALLYTSSTMSGFTEQNAPFVSPDGQTVYFSRSQNNPAVDFLFAFTDTGAALVQKWSVPVRWTTSHEHGVAADGSIYTFLPNSEFVRLDPNTGSVMHSAGVLPFTNGGNLSPKTAIDAQGRVYLSNGWASSPLGNGRLWALSADLATIHFTLSFQRQNQGGPALAAGGTLVMCDLTGVFAWRDVASTYCTAKPNSQLCLPDLVFSGTPSVTSPLPFTLQATQLINQQVGIFFYGTSGTQASPFQGGTLCVKAPLVRSPVLSSGGNPPPDDCSGVLTFDFNALIQGGTDPALVAGAQVNTQAWSRDPADPFTTSLSNALQFVIAP